MTWHSSLLAWLRPGRIWPDRYKWQRSLSEALPLARHTVKHGRWWGHGARDSGGGARARFCILLSPADSVDSVNKSDRSSGRDQRDQVGRDGAEGWSWACEGCWKWTEPRAIKMWSFVSSASPESLWLKECGRIYGSSYFRMHFGRFPREKHCLWYGMEAEAELGYWIKKRVWTAVVSPTVS